MKVKKYTKIFVLLGRIILSVIINFNSVAGFESSGQIYFSFVIFSYEFDILICTLVSFTLGSVIKTFQFVNLIFEFVDLTFSSVAPNFCSVIDTNHFVAQTF